MKYSVSVKPNAKETRVLHISETELQVFLRSTPERGKANDELIRVLAKTLSVPQLRVRIMRGATGRKKMVEVV